MGHTEDDELVMHAYGDGTASDAVDAHLAVCPECRARLEALQRDLSAMAALEVPFRGDDYGGRVWARLQPSLAATRTGLVERCLSFLTWPRLTLAAGVAGLVLAAFVAGRYSQPDVPEAAVVAEAPAAVVKERILLIAVGDHLDRSRMVLAEIVNRPGSTAAELVPERAAAEDLVATNRLYRQTALESGNPAMASALEELERMLVEIANSPDSASAADLAHLRERIESQGLIFKVTVLGSQVRQRQRDTIAPAPARPKSST